MTEPIGRELDAALAQLLGQLKEYPKVRRASFDGSLAIAEFSTEEESTLLANGWTKGAGNRWFTDAIPCYSGADWQLVAEAMRKKSFHFRLCDDDGLGRTRYLCSFWQDGFDIRAGYRAWSTTIGEAVALAAYRALTATEEAPPSDCPRRAK